MIALAAVFAIPAIFVFLNKALKHKWLLFVPAVLGIYFGTIGNIIQEGSVPFSLFQVFFLLGLLLFVLKSIYSHDFIWQRTNLEMEFLLFFGLVFFSLLYSPNYDDGLFYAIRSLLQIIFLFLLFNTLKELNHVKIVIIMIILSALILSLLSLYEYYQNPLANIISIKMGGVKERSIGTENDPNVFATFFYLPIAITAAYFFETKNMKHKIAAFALMSIFLVGIILTFSRTAFVVVIVMFFYFTIRHKDFKLIGVIIIAVLVLTLFNENIRLTIVNVINRFLLIFDSNEDSTGTRFVLFEGAMNMLFNSWFFGVGFRGFPIYFVQDYGVQQTIGVYEPHNLFYTVLSELGIVGFVVYISIFFKLFIRARACISFAESFDERVLSSGIFISFVGLILFHNSYGGGFTDNRLWMQVALILILHRYFLAKKKVVVN